MRRNKPLKTCVIATIKFLTNNAYQNREKAGATWALRNNRFCKGGDLQTSHKFKKLGTLRNQGAFFISKIRLPEFVQTG